MFSIPVKRDPVFTPSGDRLRSEFIEVVGDDGARCLRKSRDIDVFDYIQTSLDDTLIYNILDKYARGDVTALNRANGAYVDCVGLPTTFLEAHEYVKNAEKLFNQFPDELRDKFGSFSAFRDELISGKAYEKLTSYEASKSVVEPVKEVDSNVPASE